MSTSIELRSRPLSNLSFDGVEKLLEEQGLFDRSRNETGKGIRHQYEVADLFGGRFLIVRATGLSWQREGSPERRRRSLPLLLPVLPLFDVPLLS